MTDVDDENSVIPEITAESFLELKERGIVAQGMIPKLQNALKSIEEGVTAVRICKAEALLGDGGTVVMN